MCGTLPLLLIGESGADPAPDKVRLCAGHRGLTASPHHCKRRSPRDQFSRSFSARSIEPVHDYLRAELFRYALYDFSNLLRRPDGLFVALYHWLVPVPYGRPAYQVVIYSERKNPLQQSHQIANRLRRQPPLRLVPLPFLLGAHELFDL